VPLQVAGDALEIAMADPSRLMLIDEVSLLLDRRLIVRVTTLSEISDYLAKTQQSQRVLEEATEAFSLNVVSEEENGDEKLSIERLTKDSETSPVIRLVDTILFSALERRASDVHIETGDSEVIVKYRIDGVLQRAMQAISKEFHSPVISRIKVMSELDIAERRVPQDGRFRVRYKNRYIDFRVSIMPSIQSHLGCGGIPRARPEEVSPIYSGALRHGPRYGADRKWQDHYLVCGIERNSLRRRQDHYH
jgi:type IV pilus assembly protein PilB